MEGDGWKADGSSTCNLLTAILQRSALEDPIEARLSDRPRISPESQAP
jgi:hypothetical protein